MNSSPLAPANARRSSSRRSLSRPSTDDFAPTITQLTTLRMVLLVALINTAILSELRGEPIDPPTDNDRAVAVTLGSNGDAPQTVSGNMPERVCRAERSGSIPAWSVEGWQSYQRLWNELAANPDDPVLRRYLGLPVGSAAADGVVIKSNRGRSAPQWLGWKSGSYRQVETPHFQIFSHADNDATREVAADLERVFWVWTQLFFPLWESKPQVAFHLSGATADRTIASTLTRSRQRLTTRRKLRVVLLKNESDYARTLGQSMPGIDQSTGFYSDERQTSFFYPSDSTDAVATRRHELVHQLFREATRSGLAGDSPGRQSDFWLVEGIAGYFESLRFDQRHATVGGWDSPRLQYTRYRVFGRREIMPLDELRPEGQLKVQRRADLAKWYAFSIAYTHQLLDGKNLSGRRWVYDRLAKLYQVNLDVPAAQLPPESELSLVDFLRVSDGALKTNPASGVLTELCLSGSQVTGRGLATIPASDSFRWIDLTNLSISSDDLKRMVPVPSSLEQLSLESTGVDDSITDWIAKAKQISELDLSQTRCGDATISALADHSRLRTLWLTHSAITDASIPVLSRLQSIESIDLQRTAVTNDGLAKLRTAHPDWKINPLRLE
jgi:hypothetical protein